jgi:hypothetical protein
MLPFESTANLASTVPGDAGYLTKGCVRHANVRRVIATTIEEVEELSCENLLVLIL